MFFKLVIENVLFLGQGQSPAFLWFIIIFNLLINPLKAFDRFEFILTLIIQTYQIFPMTKM